jgi:hypothetical protein
MDIAAAYQKAWSFAPPRKCTEMHAAGLFESRGPHELRFAEFEFYSPAMIAEGDAYVSQQLVAGLFPIGGDRTGDRWCFDSRRRIGGTIPIAFCPHDGGAAKYVAPSFATFVYRLVLENLAVAHLFEGWGEDRAAMRAFTAKNLDLVDRWLLRRWSRRARETLDGAWPSYDDFDAFMRQDRAFSRLPRREFDHFR